MKKRVLVSLALQGLIMMANAQSRIANVYCENRINPLGIDMKQPTFNWEIASEQRNILQTAYEVRVAETAADVQKGKKIVWGSGKVSSDQSLHVAYAGAALKSGTTYYWQVRVWDNNGKASAWSTPALWQMGLLTADDWKAKWIEPSGDMATQAASPIFRKIFEVNRKIKSATAFITSHGMYEAYINGKRIGDAVLAPGWTSYSHHLQYQQYDVTALLSNGKNAVGAEVGKGWYRSPLAWGDQKDIYGKRFGLLMQINIIYTDGSTATIITDDSWKCSTGSIVQSEIYNGEIIDARKEKKGWSDAAYNDADWSAVTSATYSFDNLVAAYNEPIKKHEVFHPVKIIVTPNGEHVIDFGQNLVGWVQVKVKGKAGDSISIHHAEVLDKEGNFYTANLRVAKQNDVYILKGGEEETFEPHFTFQGFRYIKIDGFPGEIKAGNFSATALYSAMRPTGDFSCSNALINQLQHNIQWGQKGNFLDVPTDCPQRDERLGWTGDAQAFSRTASYNMNVYNFFSKWLKDLAFDQQPDGRVPHVIPNVLGKEDGGSTGWADVSTIIPWNMYLAYGDKRILEDQYPSMKAWVGFMQNNSTNFLWNKGFHFGDWLFYRPEDDNDGRSAITDKYLIAQCFFAHSTQLMINTATVLDKQDDIATYTTLLKNIKDAFMKEYMTPSGRLVSSSQTAYVLALNFDMLPENLRAQAADRLVENIHSYGDHLTTGFLGTPYLCHVLSRFGHTDVAYSLLMQKTYPSWLYPVTQGATTIWERWDGQKTDGTFQSVGMNSFNHYAYGAIGDWMYRVVTGIDTYSDAPGYKKIKVMPHIGGGLTNAKADYHTSYGTVSSHWELNNGALNFEVEIPANTTADIYVPCKSAADVTEGGKSLQGLKGFTVKDFSNGYLLVTVGSGKYTFGSSL